jgi:hypothetical protein
MKYGQLLLKPIDGLFLPGVPAHAANLIAPAAVSAARGDHATDVMSLNRVAYVAYRN